MKIFLTDSDLFMHSKYPDIAKKAMDLTLETALKVCQETLKDVDREAIVFVSGSYSYHLEDCGGLFNFTLTSFGDEDNARAKRKLSRRVTEISENKTDLHPLCIVPDYDDQFASHKQAPIIKLIFEIYLDKDRPEIEATKTGAIVHNGRINADYVRRAIKDAFREKYN